VGDTCPASKSIKRKAQTSSRQAGRGQDQKNKWWGSEGHKCQLAPRQTPRCTHQARQGWWESGASTKHTQSRLSERTGCETHSGATPHPGSGGIFSQGETKQRATHKTLGNKGQTERERKTERQRKRETGVEGHAPTWARNLCTPFHEATMRAVPCTVATRSGCSAGGGDYVLFSLNRAKVALCRC